MVVNTKNANGLRNVWVNGCALIGFSHDIVRKFAETRVMSIAIIKLNDEEVPALKKIVKSLTSAKLHIIKNEDAEEDLMARLIDEGLDSEIIPTALFKKELKKDAGHR